MTDMELFDDSFYEWLSKHGVALASGSESDGKFLARIDLNALKLGIVNLADALCASILSPEDN